AHPDVFDALVIGVPDERLGQRVAALVQLRAGRPADLAAIEAHLRGLIAGYKLPRSIWLVDAIGRTAAGKADYGWAHQHAASNPASPSPPPPPPPPHPPPPHHPPTPDHPPRPPPRTPEESRADLAVHPARHRAPDRGLHALRARGRGDQPGQRPGRAGLRPVQRPGR